MLLAVIDENCRGIYDFIYLPIDFKARKLVWYIVFYWVENICLSAPNFAYVFTEQMQCGICIHQHD